ncbi:MAG: hypothetical protein ACOY40_18185 [Bacillota bacterium]
MAGAVKEKYPGEVDVEIIYKGSPGVPEDIPKPPAMDVEGVMFGKNTAFEDLEKVVLEKLKKG